MSDAVMSLIVGFVVGVVVTVIVLVLVVRRLRNRHRSEVSRYDESLVELRRERAEDKETNRRLRHELVAHSPQQLVQSASDADSQRDAAVSERDQALEQLQLVQSDLSSANGKLADRENKLREYREALREIRESLEAQGPGPGDEMGRFDAVDGIENDNGLDGVDDLDGDDLDRADGLVDGDGAEITVLETTEPVDLGAVD